MFPHFDTYVPVWKYLHNFVGTIIMIPELVRFRSFQKENIISNVEFYVFQFLIVEVFRFFFCANQIIAS